MLSDSRRKAPDTDLAELAEAEAALAFSSMPNVTFCPGAWQKLPAAPDWQAADSAFIPHCRQLLALCGSPDRAQNLLLLVVREMDPESAEEHWIEVQRRVFYSAAVAPLLAAPPATTLEAGQVRISEGLCRDRRDLAPLIVTLALLFALLAVAFYVAALALGRHIVGSWQAWVLPPLGGFAIGLAIPLLSLRVLQNIAPAPSAAAIDSAWWPALAGMLALILPAVVLRLGLKSAGGYLGDWQIEGRWGLAMVAVALGACAFWCWPACVSLGPQAVTVLVPLVVASALLLFLFGRAIDTTDRLPVALAAVAALVALPLGLALFLGSSALLWGVAAAAGAIVLGAEVATRARGTKRTKAAARAAAGDGQPCPRRSRHLGRSTRPGLVSHVSATGRFRRNKYATGPICRRPNGLVGAVRHDRIGQDRGCPAHYRSVECQRSGSRSPVWQLPCGRLPLRTVPSIARRRLRRHCAGGRPTAERPSRFHAARARRSVRAVLCDVGRKRSRCRRRHHNPERFDGRSLRSSLRKLTRNRHVVLFIDNVHWLDDGSAALLKHLRERMPPEGELPLMILLVGRDDTRLRSLGLETGIVRVPVPSRPEQLSILTGSLRIDPDSAQHILDAMGVLAEEPGGLFWLGRAVVELVDAGAFEATDKGFALRADFLAKERLPVPAELRSELAARLRGSPQDQAVAECAALLGAQFRVSDLADSLAIDRLDLLRTLERFERELRICRDVVDDDDRYAFSSAFMLEVVRAEFGLLSVDRLRQKPAKIVQELHARIAATLERRAQKDPSVLYALAEHYHAAGDHYAEKGVEFGLLAARAARAQFAFENARSRLQAIESAARLLGRAQDLTREALLIDFDEANVTGRNRQVVAARGIEHLASVNTADRELTMSVARACYDAGRDSGHAKWFEHAARLAHQTIEHSTTATEQAEGHHLLGISLPVSRVAERLESLRRGLQLLNPTGGGTATDRLLGARLLDSLAEQLSHGGLAERLEARSLFERSLSIRRAPGTGDLPGQARALGGLGRLSLASDPADFAQAARYFQEDLQISQEIGDTAGQSLCHSFLGRCDRGLNQLPGALDHFRQAEKLALSPKDRLFAYAGMLDVSMEMDKPAEVESIGRKLLAEIDSQPLPEGCAAELVRVLSIHSAQLRDDWARLLADRLTSH